MLKEEREEGGEGNVKEGIIGSDEKTKNKGFEVRSKRLRRP